MTTINLNRRSRATQEDILNAFAERLRQVYDPLNERNVVVDDQAIPAITPPGRFYITISPGEGQFDKSLWETNGHATANEEGTIVVCCMSVNRRDPAGRSSQALLGTDGLLPWKRKILAAYAVEYPNLRHISPPWEPMKLDVEADEIFPLLRNPPRPVHVTSISDVTECEGWRAFQIAYSCSWDWDLYGGD